MVCHWKDSRLDLEDLKNKIETDCFGKNINYYDEVDSTNTIAKNLGKNSSCHGTLIFAEQQNLGRGRLGRTWSSPKGEGIWMSLIVQPDIHPPHGSLLTLVTALAVNKAIREVTGLASFIKWPNDIVVNGKKVCGILIEMSASMDKVECIIIGIGINTNQEYFPKEISQTATSLFLESGKEINRETLIAKVMLNLEQYYNIFIKSETLEELIEEYETFLINKNKQVKVIHTDKEEIGIALGINELGALLVEVDSKGCEKEKVVKTIFAGEVSVRGICGYV